jgi:Domain of unknown function (DUF4184)
MPVTPAHAAVAWPLRRFAPGLPTAAVVIGSLSPDFEYLLRLQASGPFGHTALGIATFCLPVSLLVWAIFQQAVRPALVDLLPPGIAAGLAQRFAVPETRSRAGRWARAAVAATLGAITHVVWDSFTHASGWGVARLPVLASTVGLSGLGPLPIYKLLQYGSSLAGGALLLLWAARGVTGIPPALRKFQPGQRSRAIRAVVGLLCASFAGGALNALRAQGRRLPVVLGFAVVGAMVAFSLALLVLAATRRRPHPDDR